jgi:hypothetical protein
MNSAPQEIVNELKYAIRARQILRWATISRHTKHSEHLSKEIDTRVHQSLNALNEMNICIFKSRERDAAVHPLVSLLSSSKGTESEQAARALWKIVLELDKYTRKSVCVETNAVPALVSLLASRKGAEAERAAAVLIVIAAGDTTSKAACVSAGAVPALVSLLSSFKGATLSQPVWALWNISKGDDTCKAACVQAGVVPALVTMISAGSLSEEAESVAELTLIAIANHSPEYRQLVINAGFNPYQDE